MLTLLKINHILSGLKHCWKNQSLLPEPREPRTPGSVHYWLTKDRTLPSPATLGVHQTAASLVQRTALLFFFFFDFNLSFPPLWNFILSPMLEVSLHDHSITCSSQSSPLLLFYSGFFIHLGSIFSNVKIPSGQHWLFPAGCCCQLPSEYLAWTFYIVLWRLQAISTDYVRGLPGKFNC